MTSGDASGDFASAISGCAEIVFAQESFMEQIECRFLERNTADVNLRNLKNPSIRYANNRKKQISKISNYILAIRMFN